MLDAPSLAIAAAFALATPLAAPALPELAFLIGYENHVVTAKVASGDRDFLGAVVIAETKQLVHSLIGLPPLLLDAQILAVGQASAGTMALSIPVPQLPDVAILVYAQAVILDDGALLSSGVESLRVPAAPIR